MDQETNMWFHGVPPGTDNFGTKAPRVDETGSSYGVNAAPAPIIQQSPIEQYFLSLPECLDSPKVYEVARGLERKKQIDKAYRQRCREKRMKTEENLVSLEEENNKLKRENSQLKMEEVRLQGIVQAQNDTMKQLHREFDQLKGQLGSQNTVVEVLSKQLATYKDNNLQRENKWLKLEKDRLMKKIGNKDSFNMIQLEAKYIKLEQEKSALQVIIDALCAKINRDN